MDLTPLSRSHTVTGSCSVQPVAIEELGPLLTGKNRGHMTNLVLAPGKYYVQIETRNEPFFEFLTINLLDNDGHGTLYTCKVRDETQQIVESCDGKPHPKPK